MVKPVVIITGDLDGAGYPQDPIRLVFLRLTNNINAALDVYYTIDWKSTSPDEELEDPTKIEPHPEQSIQKITIPARENGVVVTLRPTMREPNVPRQFMLTVSAKKENGLDADYATLAADKWAKDLRRWADAMASWHPPVSRFEDLTGFAGTSSAVCYIYDGAVLFASDNAKPDLADYLFGTKTADPRGVNINDIRQGMIGDCALGAALAALALRRPDFIHDDLFEISGEASVTVKLRALGHSNQIVDMQLAHGSAQMWPSGDTELNLANGEGRVEVWPVLVEKALAKDAGGYASLEAIGSNEVWYRILGTWADEYHPPEVPCPEELWYQIGDAIDAGKMVVVGTRSDGSVAIELSNGDVVYRRHAYTATAYDSSANQITLYNPWGEKHAGLPMADFMNVITWVWIL